MRSMMAGAAASLSLLLGVAASAAAQTTPAPKPEEKKPPAATDPKKAPPPPAKPPVKPAPKPVEKKAPPPPPPAKKAPAPAPAPVEESKPAGKPIGEWERATEGPMGSFWKKLEDNGLDVRIRYQNDFTRLQKGGIDPHNNADRYWLDITGTYDLAKAGLAEGMSVTAAYWQMGGENGTADVGSIHHISPLESTSRKEFAEFYVEWDDFVQDMRIKLGKMDGTGEWAAAELGGDFMTMGRGFPPNVLGVPAWPDPAFGGALFYEPVTGPYLQVGVFDGAGAEGKVTGERGIGTAFGEPAGASYLFETGFHSRKWGRPVKMGVGAWYHSSDFAEFDGGTSEGTNGWYAIVEGQLVKHDRNAQDDPRGLWLMFRYSAADEEVLAIEHEYVAAVVWRGVCNARPKDSLGVAWVQGNLSDDASAGFDSHFEQVMEGYYKFQVTGFFSVSACIQQIWNPGGMHDDALVFGLRAVLDF